MLDNTGVHPERYPALEGFARSVGKSLDDLVGAGVELVKSSRELRNEVGELTFADIVNELNKPGRDPREQFVSVAFRDDIHELKDLTPGMVCPGVVTNVTNFGAFVDIGVHQDGLVHISQLSDRFVKDPREVVSPGDRVTVRVIEVNLQRRQIALSMKRTRDEGNTQSVAREKGNSQPQREAVKQKPTENSFNNPFQKLRDFKK